MDAGYIHIWKYLVPPESAAAFEKAYGPDGEWVSLFRQHEGYLHTELHKDLADPDTFLTIDYWQSQEAYDSFREQSADEFKQLDDKFERLNNQETYIGEFSPVD